MEDWEKAYQDTLKELQDHPILPELNSSEPEVGVWYKKQISEGICGGGWPYCVYLKKGRSDCLAVFMIGGGLSYCQETARCPGTLKATLQGKTPFYTDEVQPGNDIWFFNNPHNTGFLTMREDNKFVDWSIAMINYGTADFHIGQSDFRYTDENGESKILYHHGYANFQASLRQIQELFPSPEKLLIAGESAGAFAVPAVAKDIMDAYSDCVDVTIYSDSALMLYPHWRQVVTDVWKAPEHIEEGVQTDNILVDFYRQLAACVGKKAKYLFSCGVGDSALIMYQNFLEESKFVYDPEKAGQMRERLSRQVAQLQSLEVSFGFYIHDFVDNGMGQHCTLAAHTFIDGNVDGVSPMEWLWKAVNGEVSSVGLRLFSEIQDN